MISVAAGLALASRHRVWPYRRAMVSWIVERQWDSFFEAVTVHARRHSHPRPGDRKILDLYIARIVQETP